MVNIGWGVLGVRYVVHTFEQNRPLCEALGKLDGWSAAAMHVTAENGLGELLEGECLHVCGVPHLHQLSS